MLVSLYECVCVITVTVVLSIVIRVIKVLLQFYSPWNAMLLSDGSPGSAWGWNVCSVAYTLYACISAYYVL